MTYVNSLWLMREATRRAQAEIATAVLVQVSSLNGSEIPSSYQFWFANLDRESPIRSAIINFQNGSWGPIQKTREPIVGVVDSDLLRVELSVADAVSCIRDSGYQGLMQLGGLLQPLVANIPPNPLYNFHAGSTILFVDAVTGVVSKQEGE